MVVDNLYYRHPNNAAPSLSVSIDSDIVYNALNAIYHKDFNSDTDIDPALFSAFWSKFNEAADKGISASQAHSPEDDFRAALKYNNAVFSAFKVHRLQHDVAAQLTDSNGNLKPFKQWMNDVKPIASHQCVNWFQSEYSMAVARAHQAADWQQFEREKDILPNLEWMPSTAVHPDAEHSGYIGTILPVDDSFWNTHHPGDHWGCLCSLTSTTKPCTERPDTTDNPQPGLDNNPGKDAKLFSDSHPYIANCTGYPELVRLAADKIATASSRIDVRNYMQNMIAKKDIVIEPGEGPISQIPVTWQGIKCITGKPHKFGYLKNLCCYYLPEIMKKAEYMGNSGEIKGMEANGHGDVLRWHYYKFKLYGEYSYITVKESTKGNSIFHSIQDQDHFDEDKIKNPQKKR